MSRFNIAGVFLSFVAISSSQAAILVTSDAGVAIPNKPGFKRFTVSVTSTVANEQIQGVDFAGDGSNNPATGKGFFGNMAQLGPPTISTVYQNNNNLIPLLNPGHTSAEDSQFMVNSGASNIAHPSGLDEEGPTILQGIWAWTDPQGVGPIPFAQLVIPDAASGTVSFRGSFSLNTPSGIIDSLVINGGCFDCGLLSPVDADLGNRTRGSVISHSFMVTSSQTPPYWSNLITAGPNTPFIPPVLNEDGKFTWNTAGSALGLYKFDATVSDFGGSAVAHLTVNLVPESATTSFVGLAVLGCCCFLRRRHD